MLQIKFKNIQRSEFIEKAVQERVDFLVDKFPDLESHDLTVTVEMENSPRQTGPDLFTVKLLVNGSKFQKLSLLKAASNPYLALAEVFERTLERLNRHNDKKRVKDIKQRRTSSILNKKLWSEIGPTDKSSLVRKRA